MYNNLTVTEEFDKFIDSDEKNCLITGTLINKKHLSVLKYLNDLGKKIRILVRVNSMSNLEDFFGKKYKTGAPYKVGNLTIYFDSMDSKSQRNTPREFSGILIYPANSLKGVDDKNIIDVLNFRESQKVFWISSHDNTDFGSLKELCDIKHNVVINDSDAQLHNRVLDNTTQEKQSELLKIEVENLSYSSIEIGIAKFFKLGNVYTSSLSQSMNVGEFDCFILGGERRTSSFIIKAKKDEVGQYYILIKETNKT